MRLRPSVLQKQNHAGCIRLVGVTQTKLSLFMKDDWSLVSYYEQKG